MFSLNSGLNEGYIGWVGQSSAELHFLFFACLGQGNTMA
jgi:hypothetical protein